MSPFPGTAVLGSAPPRSSWGGKLYDAFCKQSQGRAEQVCKLLSDSVLELQPQKIQELLACCMSFLETAPGRTQKMDFNLEKPRRKPLTWLLKCLGANFDLLSLAYRVLYTRAVRFNLKHHFPGKEAELCPEHGSAPGEGLDGREVVPIRAFSSSPRRCFTIRSLTPAV